MNDFEQNIRKAGAHYSLSHDERAKISRVLRQYMAHRPLPQSVRGRLGDRTRTPFPWFSILYRPIAIALVMVLVCGTGISYAAEGALPGDVLYAVKTSVNEPLRVALASGPEAKANVQIGLAETRIDEATTLASEGRLDTQTQDQLAIAFEVHASAASDNISKTDDEDSPAAAELASRFETRLAAHDAILAQVESDAATNTATLSQAIRGAGHTISSIRSHAEEKASVSAHLAAAPVATLALAVGSAAATAEATNISASAKSVPSAPPSENVSRAAALRMQSAAGKQFKNVKKEAAAAPADTAVDAQIESAQKLIDQGSQQLDSNSFALAFHSFQDSLVITEKLDVLLQAAPSLAKAKARSNRSRGSSPKQKEIRDAALRVHVRASGAAPAITPASASTTIDTNAHALGTSNTLPASIRIFPKEDDREDSDSGDKSDHKGSGKIKTDISL